MGLIKTFRDLARKGKIAINVYAINQVSFRTRILGTVLIVLSGTLLVLDKLLDILGIEGSATFGYSNFSNFIWAFTQSVSPILMTIGFYLKPYKTSFLVPVYCYGLQLIWVFGISHSDKDMQYVYALGICAIYILLVFAMKFIMHIVKRKEKEDAQFISEAKDVLEILKSKVLETQKV